MRKNHTGSEKNESMNRRGFIGAATLAIGALGTIHASAQSKRDWTNVTPVRYPDPDVIALDPRFGKYKIGNAAIHRIDTGMQWAEGPAWNGVGNYLVYSDIPSNTQRRWLNENGAVSVMRKPSGNSNGNTFDFQGRQISCEHANRRVVRYEYDGSVTVLASSFNGKPLNAPNDAVVHPDGGIWFTDPGYGSMWDYEGNKGPLHLKEAVYRIDPDNLKLTKVADDPVKPNGLCFSPDYTKLYIADTGAGAPKPTWVYDVTSSSQLKNGRIFCKMEVNGIKGGSDGIRTDVDGNVWHSAGWAGNGFDGVLVFAPDGDLIGQIKLPEICSNVCFGGPKRNRLFMTASQSLYAVYTATRGSHIC